MAGASINQKKTTFGIVARFATRHHHLINWNTLSCFNASARVEVAMRRNRHVMWKACGRLEAVNILGETSTEKTLEKRRRGGRDGVTTRGFALILQRCLIDRRARAMSDGLVRPMLDKEIAA
eukprot:scaffold323526_cov31-Tisochrysis_lutea.AAC.2